MLFDIIKVKVKVKQIDYTQKDTLVTSTLLELLIGAKNQVCVDQHVLIVFSSISICVLSSVSRCVFFSVSRCMLSSVSRYLLSNVSICVLSSIQVDVVQYLGSCCPVIRSVLSSVQVYFAKYIKVRTVRFFQVHAVKHVKVCVVQCVKVCVLFCFYNI